MGRALVRWLILCVAVWAATFIPFFGITYEGWTSILIASLFLALVNAFVKPILVLFTFPLVLLSLGLFIWVINAVLLYFVSWMMGPAFVVPSFGSALGASLVISFVSMLLGTNVKVQRGGTNHRDQRRPPSGKGPVIDI